MNEPVIEQEAAAELEPHLHTKIAGEPYLQLPEDLFIPPEAMRVFLEAFEGPLDLLLYLIRKHNLDILTINVAEITRQYMHYLDLMQELQLELAGEYLVMAALLAEIKSRSLLPRHHHGEEDQAEEDPRAELIRRLLEYERYKTAAERLDQLPRQERDLFPVQPERPDLAQRTLHPDVDLRELLLVFGQLLNNSALMAHHQISREPLSTRARMSLILERLEQAEAHLSLAAFFDPEEGRAGVVVAFMALLELIKEQLVELVQVESFAPIYARLKKETSHE
ncbi:ScpA family protein [Marinospirillum sp. MEB164]|uniref:Segregation and condensation protein A n=1 Tax=Marinospirillum alkalitolerans TaxID=3123374 RepID=A0ABW8PTL4_9GAMM